MAALMVGFDLDMTLADTRRGIAAVYDALAAETGVFIDSAVICTRLGPPLEAELANWYPAKHVPAMVRRFRELYPAIAIPVTKPMAGAYEAVHAVRERDGHAMVVTGKNQRDAERTVRLLGLPVTVVIGPLFAAGKAVALRAHGAAVYVGDHTGDVDAARAAGAVSVGVASGPYDAAALRAYGADIVLPDLVAFPDWLGSYPSRNGSHPDGLGAPHK